MTDSEKGDKLIFIGGIQRSGTSLLRAIIGSHPDVSIVQWDLPLWIKFHQIYKNKKFSDRNYQRLTDSLFSHEKMIKAESKADPEQFDRLYREKINSWCSFHKAFFNYHRDLSGCPRAGLKTPFNEFYFEDIRQCFPDSKFIHVVRHPLDAASSYKKVKEKSWGGSTNFYHHIQQWKRSVGLGRAFQEKYPEQYRVIKYEDLLDNPEKETREICGFLGLEFHPQMLEMSGHPGWKGHNSSFDGQSKKETGINKTSRGRYKKYLSRHELVKYKTLLGKYLEYFQYEVDVPQRKYALALKSAFLVNCFYFNVKDRMIRILQRSFLYPYLKSG